MIDLEALTKEELQAISVLKANGWQILSRPYLEDWDDGQVVKTRFGDESVGLAVDVVMIKVDV